MLTLEVLKANQALTGLTDDQLNAIVTMSKNDEEVVIGKRIGELHGSYDNDILSVTSVKKNDGEKSYDYLKRVLNNYKSKAAESDGLKTKLRESEQRVTDLQKQVDGGNSEISRQLKDEKDLTASLKQQLEAKTSELDKAKKEFDERLLGVRVDNAFEAIFSGLTFKQDITEPVKAAMKIAAKSEVMSKGAISFDETRNELVIRNDKGEILRNQANNMNPYTLEELVKETAIKDILMKNKSGIGSTPPSGVPGADGQDLLDFTGIKTQSEADEAISKHLEAKGFQRDTDEFWSQYGQLREANNVAALPLR